MHGHLRGVLLPPFIEDLHAGGHGAGNSGASPGEGTIGVILRRRKLRPRAVMGLAKAAPVRAGIGVWVEGCPTPRVSFHEGFTTVGVTYVILINEFHRPCFECLLCAMPGDTGMTKTHRSRSNGLHDPVGDRHVNGNYGSGC